MRRRNKTGGKPAKTQRSKTLKRRDAPRIARRRKPSAADATETIALLTRERDEALQQQTATAAVLKVMSRSTFDLSKVLNTLVESAARLCEADKARILRPTGKEASYYVAALYGSTTPEYEEHVRTLKLFPGRGSVVGRVLLEGKSVHIPDVLADPEYTLRETARLAGYRTSLGVPLLREGNSIGLLVLQRATVRPFIDKEIELATAFADQAVIAIENTRLLNDLRQRTDDLSEALEQQTATSEVLKIVSSSPGNMKPVFEAMLANALRICDAKFGHILLYDGERYHAAYLHEVPSSYREFWEQHGPIRPGPNTGLARLARTKQVSHIPDLKADATYAEREPLRVVTVEQAGARSLLAVPMLKENDLIGAIVIYRQEVRPFTDKQIELVKNFAAQAVIAIENTRLLNELRESLQQQTATADVLKAIAGSGGEVALVFETMLENAVRICEASYGNMWLCEGEDFRTAALHGPLPPTFVEKWRSGTLFSPGPEVPAVRAAKTRQPVQVADLRADQAYLDGDPLAVSGVEEAGMRTTVAVPMLKENRAVGVIVIYRKEVRAFSDKQIELLSNFAAQAVIAIENARLLNELRESLQQQTATADVLKVISTSPGELEPVFQALLANATRLCEAKFGVLWLHEDGAFRAVALHNAPPRVCRRATPRASDTALARTQSRSSGPH